MTNQRPFFRSRDLFRPIRGQYLEHLRHLLLAQTAEARRLARVELVARVLGISPVQSRPDVTERVRVVPELVESEGTVGSQLGHDVLGGVLDVMGKEAEGLVGGVGATSKRPCSR